MMPYRWSGLPATISAVWMPYDMMFDEFATELSNTINDLTNHVRRLRAWAVVVAPLSDKARLDATHEFIDVLGTVAVNLPYVIRSRFIFAAAHLSHQANLTDETREWVDDLPLDKDIYLDIAERYGRGWKKFNTLKRRLEAISGKAYQRNTHDFRNAYNHRFSPRFVVGETQLVTRRVNPAIGRAFYAIGGLPPLDLGRVAELLAAERDRCYLAFDAFQDLVREHEAAILDWHGRRPPL